MQNFGFKAWLVIATLKILIFAEQCKTQGLGSENQDLKMKTTSKNKMA